MGGINLLCAKTDVWELAEFFDNLAQRVEGVFQ